MGEGERGEGGGGRGGQSQKERSNDNKLEKRKKILERQTKAGVTGWHSSSLKAPASVTPTYEREQTHNLLIIVFAGRSYSVMGLSKSSLFYF